MQPDFFAHVMPLTSHDADGAISGTIEFLTSRWSKWGVTWLLLVLWHHLHPCEHYILPMVSSVAQLHALGQTGWNEVQHDYFGNAIPQPSEMASCDANGIIDTTAFLTSRRLKWGTTWLFHHVTPLESANIMWCHWHWQHMTPMTPFHFLGQDDQNEVQHDFLVIDVIGTSITWPQWHHQCHMILMP